VNNTKVVDVIKFVLLYLLFLKEAVSISPVLRTILFWLITGMLRKYSDQRISFAKMLSHLTVNAEDLVSKYR